MFPLAAGDGRKLHERGPGARGPVVDRDGVALGPSCSLVESVNGSYRVIEPPAAALLLSTVFDYEEDPRPFLALCHSIAKALCDGNLLRAQLLGLQMPVGPLGPHHLTRLDHFARMAKAGFDPNQPRVANGEWDDGSTSVPSEAVRTPSYQDDGRSAVGVLQPVSSGSKAVQTYALPGAALALAAYNNFRAGRYGWAIADAAGSLVDAAIGVASLGVGTIVENSAQSAVIAAEESVPVIEVSAARFGQAADHIVDAQAAGQPNILTIERLGVDANRAAVTGRFQRVPDLQLDEYPPAMFREGGVGASVRAISPADNMSAGAYIGNCCRVLPDGSKIRIRVVK